MGKTAILALRIIGDADSGVAALGQFDNAAQRSISTLDKASIAAGAVLGGLTVAANKLEQAGEAAATADARVANITESMGLMGDRAGEVTERVLKSGEALAKLTGIDPNVIKQGQATLNTFDKIASTADQVGGVFDRATVASADLASAGFGSVESASTMLGKALNDPLRGLTSLTRVGVTFTDEQRAQIEAMVEAGDVLSAQQQILAAVEQQVGGTAEATANASDKMNVAWQLAEEELGKKLLPLFEQFRDVGIEVAGWVGDNAELVLILAGALGTLSAGVLVINGAMKAYAAIQALQTAAQSANNAAWLASPITWIVLAVIAAIALLIAIIVLVVENWEYLSQVAADVWAGIIGWIETASAWLRDGIGSAVNDVNGFFSDLGDGISYAFKIAVGWIIDAYNWLRRLIDNATPGWVKDLLGLGDVAMTAAVPAMPSGTLAASRMLFTAQETTAGFAQPATTKMSATGPTPSYRGDGPSGPGGDYYDVQINFNGLVTDPEGTAREIREILSDDALRQGRRRPEEANAW